MVCVYSPAEMLEKRNGCLNFGLGWMQGDVWVRVNFFLPSPKFREYGFKVGNVYVKRARPDPQPGIIEGIT